MEGSALDENASVLSQTHSMTYIGADGINEQIMPTFSRYVFPIIDELTITIPVNKYFVPLVIVILFLQSLIVSFVPFGRDVWIQNESSWKTIRIWAYLIDFGASNDLELVSQAVIIIVYNLISLAIWLFIILYYKNTKKIIKSLLYALRTTMSYTNHVMVIPTFTIFGLCFSACFQENNSINIMITVVLIMLSGMLLIEFYIDTTFRSGTLYIENTSFAQFLNTDVYLFFTIDILYTFNTRLLYFSPRWTLLVLIGSYCVVKCYILVRFFFMPFNSNFLNAFFASIAISQIVASILVVVPRVHQLIKLLLPIGIIIFSAPLSYFALYLIRKREKGTDISTELKAQRALRVFFSEHPAEFVTWELVKRISSIHQSPLILTIITRLMSFFPGESYQLFALLLAGLKRIDLTPYELFVFYQARKVYLLRQSINTTMVRYDVENIRKDINVMVASIRTLFIKFVNDRSIFSMNLMIGLTSKRSAIISSCRELLVKYPNNPIVAREYSKFLIECCSNFTKGLKWFLLATSVENGKKVAGDQCFKTMIESFPIYIKNGIISSNGTKIANSDCSSSRRHYKNSISLDSNDDRSLCDELDINDEKVKALFSQPRLRIAFSSALKKLKSKTLSSNIVVILLSFILIYVVFSACFICTSYSVPKFEKKTEASSIVASFLSHLNLAFITFIEIWGNESKTTNQDNYDHIIEPNYMKINRDYLKSNAYEAMKEFVYLIQYLSPSDDIIFHKHEDQENTIYYPNSKYILLLNGSIVSENSSSILMIYSTMLELFEASLINYTQQSNWLRSNFVCEVLLNFKKITEYFNSFSDNFISMETTTLKINLKYIGIIAAIFIPILLLILIIPNIIIQIKIMQKSKLVFKILGLSSNNTLNEAAKPICIPDYELQGVSYCLDSKGATLSQKISFVIISSFTFAAWIGLTILIFCKFQESIKNYNDWISYSSRRLPSAISLLSAVYFGVFRMAYPDIEWLKYDIYQINETYQALLKLHNYLIEGSEYSPPCVGALKKLDDLHFSESCNIKNETINIHNMYKCMSLDQMIMLYTQLGSDIEKYFQSNKNDNFVYSDLFVHFRYLALYHVIPSLSLGVNYTFQIRATNLSSFTFQNTLLYISAIILAIIYLSVNLYWHYQVKSAFKMFKIFIARLSPLSALENAPLINLIESKLNNNVIKSSLPKSIVSLSPTPIIMYRPDGLIIFVNDSAVKALKMTREQTIGQQISSIFQVDQLDNIDDNIISIKGERQSDDLRMNITRISGNTNILIINDVTKIERMRSRLDDINETINNVHSALVPFSLSHSLRMHQEISTSEFIAVVKIEIVHYSSYVASIVPVNVLKNTETIMECFERSRRKYSLINRLQISGSNYECVVGLYSDPEIRRSTIATQAVAFAMDCMKEIEYFNHTIESSLQLRIGVSCGGPAYFSFISLDSPMLTVIGKPVKRSSEILNVAIKGQLLVCEETYKLLTNDFFVVQNNDNVSDGQKTYQVYVDIEN